jgi:deoxyribonuclease V
VGWPATDAELVSLQRELAALAGSAEPWRPHGDDLLAGGAFVASSSSAGPGPEHAWAAAVAVERGVTVASAVVAGEPAAPYAPGLLALRQGALLERAVRALGRAPDVLLVNATGADHPRGAGLALHLGWALDVPTVGVTDRPLVAQAGEPAPAAGSWEPLVLEGREVGAVVRTREATRPVVSHAGWRTDPEVAREVVLRLVEGGRTPGPIRRARHLARVARARDEGRLPPGWRATEPVSR